MDETIEIIGEVLQVLQGLGVVPAWAIVLVAVLVAVAVVLLRRLSLGALLRRVGKRLTSIQPEPDPVEHPPSPPIPMPEDGIPMSPPTRGDFDP